MGSIINSYLFLPHNNEENEQEKNDSKKILRETRHGSKIEIRNIIKNKDYLYMIISHGNAENINSVYRWVTNLLLKFVNVNIIIYEYTGYGNNEEQFSCSEQFCYNDAEAVYEYVNVELGIPHDRIIIFGRSLGSGPSCYLAEKYPVAGLILNSGFTSVFRILFKFRWTLPFDMFPNIDRLKKINCPVCIVHSIKDEVVPFFHAKEMYRCSKNKFPPLYIDGTSHNTIDRYSDDVYLHMQKFFKYIDPNYEMKNPSDFYKNN